MPQTSVKISVPGNHLMTALLGPRDELLHQIEGSFGNSDIHVRGNEVTIDGPDAELVGKVFEELVVLVQQGQSIKLVTRGAGFVASAEGKAMTDAAAGAVIQVKIQGGQLLSGIVQPDGSVERNN